MARRSTTENDEDLARRLQFEEQFTTRSVSRNTEQEQADMELARQYAQMDLAAQQAERRSSSTTDYPKRIDDSTHREPIPSRVDDFRSTKSPRVSRRHSSEWGDSPSHRRLNTEQRANIPRHPFDYSGTFPPAGPIHSMDRRSVRSQSPPTSPLQRMGDMARASLSTHQRSNSFDPDHEFLVRSGAYQQAGRTADVRELRERRSTEDFASRATAASSLDVDSQLEYARQLQLQAFANLQRTATSSNSSSDDDMMLAQRLQDLENRGMGRLNHPDPAVSSAAQGERMANLSLGHQTSSHTRKQPPNGEADHANNDLERLIAESGIDVNELSDDMLNELFGPDAASHVKQNGAPASAATVEAPAAQNVHLHPNSPRMKALRAALSGVSADDLEDPRFSPQRKVHPKSPGKVLRSPPSIESVPPESYPKSAQAVPILDAEVELVTPSKQRRKRRGFLGLGRSSSRENLEHMLRDSSATPPLVAPVDDPKPPGGIPGTIPRPPGASLSVPPPPAAARLSRSMSPPVRTPSSIPAGIPPGIPSANHGSNAMAGIPGGIRPKPAGGAYVGNNSFNGSYGGTNVCSACGLTHGTFLKAFNRRYHPECFRCKSCNGKIDPNDQFKYTTDEHGKQHPHHRECFLSFGVKCCICRQTIPATPDGRVPFIKHPFFDNEEMCIRHADENLRRCCGCQRFEPYDGSFIDLMDGDRCVCPACCRSVIVDAVDVKPLWKSVIAFFENELKLTVWGAMRDIPTLLMGSDSLREQMNAQNHIHAVVAHPMASGLCLTERSQSGNNREDVVAILCLTGLPRDLAAGVLAHQAMHAWIKLHPEHDASSQIPTQIEEGLCQLTAMLFLTDGQIGQASGSNGTNVGPTDEKLRQYFKYTIEREKSEIYGTGFRMAAAAYRDIGIEELMSYVFRFKAFPLT